MTDKQFPCGNCGADMQFDPSARMIKCQYCGHENPIPQSEEDIHELDFHAHLAELSEAAPAAETSTVKCQSCAAETTLAPNVAADDCPFCGGHLATDPKATTKIEPKSLLPFKVSAKEALELFRQWVKTRWFAPNKLKHYARTDSSRLAGMYVPYWTYDANATTFYRGERGDHYYVTESYTATENGKAVTKTRRVRRTRWSSVSGVVYDNFDDILILASRSLPKKYADRLEPWDLPSLVPYDQKYLAGFRAENYQIGLGEGFDQAKDVMAVTIRRTVNHDIGGDEQRISTMRTQHDNVTFKHILLPVWISAYRLGETIYRFLVNARTGEVQGERPYSAIKIALAVIAALGVIGSLVYLFTR